MARRRHELLYGPFDVPTVLDMSERHRVTHTFAAPSMLAGLAADPTAAGRDWSALGCILIGGAPVTDATINAGRRVFGDVIYQVFGQTEATPLTIMTPQEWFTDVPGSTPMRSAGRVLPFCRLEIRGPAGEVLGIGGEGEIWTQVEAQMSGYWGDPQRTAERLVDGWVRTGDIGRLDDNGYLYVLDRVDDMIVSGGFNIWPAELETIIADHPDVVEVAVFGIPDTRWGETPMAICTLRPGARSPSRSSSRWSGSGSGPTRSRRVWSSGRRRCPSRSRGKCSARSCVIRSGQAGRTG